MIQVGCCGFPKARRTYAKVFPVVEVQATFYRLVPLKRLVRWREEAPEEFEFTLKASQVITHQASSLTYRRFGKAIPQTRKKFYGRFQDSREVREAWEHTRKCAEALRARIIVFQCPPKFGPSEENVKNLRRFFKALSRKDFLFAWEPRGGWEPRTVRALCRELGLIDCVDPFLRPPTTRWMQYFRLHGGKGYSGTYSDKDLKSLQSLCRAKSYVLFNNYRMWEDGQRFMKLCGG